MAYLKQITHDPSTADYWDTQTFLTGTTVTEQPTANLSCSQCSWVFTRGTPAGTREDQAVWSIYLADVVGGGLYSQLDATKMATAEAAMTTLWTSLKTKVVPQWTLQEWRWHNRRADNPETPKHNEKVGPAVRVTSVALPGTGTGGRGPDQVASTLTIRTASRKHWGRIYLGGLAEAIQDNVNGRITSADVDTLTGYFHTFEATLNSASIQWGVWTWKFKAFMPMTEMRMDNVWDIVRRRRAKQSSYFKSYVS